MGCVHTKQEKGNLIFSYYVTVCNAQLFHLGP